MSSEEAVETADDADAQDAESTPEENGVDSPTAEGEHATRRTGDREECRRCGREQGLVGKYRIWLCRQCFRETARGMGFHKYR